MVRSAFINWTIVCISLTPVTLHRAVAATDGWPPNLQVVIDNTQPVKPPRNGRLPLFVLPITNALSQLDDDQARQALRQLDERGIGYSVDWNHDQFDMTLAEGIRIAQMQREIGQPITVNANACLYSFFDGSELVRLF